MDANEIASRIIQSIPGLPDQEVLDKLVFRWNEEGLSPWDGGHDVHGELRESVMELLEANIRANNLDFAAFLRFILQQEIHNCCQGEMSTLALRISYDRLAALEFLEDIPLLLEANDASFDANCALYKNRLFYRGYEHVMQYLLATQDQDVLERVRWYAEAYGYDKEPVREEEKG